MFRLDGGGETMLIAQRPGPPVLAYWGPALADEVDLDAVEALGERAIPHGMLDAGEVFDLLPEAARGFTGHPAIEVHRPTGGFLTQLEFLEARAEPDRCEILLADRLAGIEVSLFVSLDAASGVAAFGGRLVNAARRRLVRAGGAADGQRRDDGLRRKVGARVPVRSRAPRNRLVAEGEPHRPHLASRAAVRGRRLAGVL